MAKKSAVNRNEMVKRLVKTMAAKREALKAVANDESLPLEERFSARLKLAKLPRNSSKTRIRNRGCGIWVPMARFPALLSRAGRRVQWL